MKTIALIAGASFALLGAANAQEARRLTPKEQADIAADLATIKVIDAVIADLEKAREQERPQGR
jgi:hypothetical protein